MSAGAALTQSLTAAAGAYAGGFEGVTEATNAPEVFYGAVTSKKPAALASVRLNPASATAAGSVTALTKYSVNNSMHVLLHCRFATASQSATFALALYDGADTLISITRDYTIQADASYTDGTYYMAPAEIIDVAVATKVGIIVRTLPAGNVYVYLDPM